MKKYKTQIVTVINVALIILSVFLSLASNNGIYLFLTLLALLVIRKISFRLEMKPVVQKLNEYTQTSDYGGAISCLLDKINNCYFKTTNETCMVYLIAFYMNNDQVTEAKTLLKKYPKLKKSKFLSYINFILALADNDKYMISYYANKTLSLKNKAYDIQKDRVKKILQMLNTKEMNMEIYENTNIPLLKRICLKIKGEDVILIPNDIEKNICNNEVKTLSTKRKVLNKVLNIFTCLSLLFALICIAIRIEQANSNTMFESSYNFLKSFWLFWAFLPIPICNIINGMDLKTKNNKTQNNFVLGIVFSILLFLFGLGHVIFVGTYSKDKSYLEKLEQKINIDFPNDFEIVVENATGGIQESANGTTYKYGSLVTVKGSKVENFDVNLWKEEITNTDKLPLLYTYSTENFEKHLVYCFDTKEYNPQTYYHEYDYVVIGYDYETNIFLIYEFNVE